VSDWNHTCQRRARTVHQCCECGCVILPEETYLVDAGVWDGSWTRFKTCLECAAWSDVAHDLAFAWCLDGPAFGGLVAWLETYCGGVYCVEPHS